MSLAMRKPLDEILDDVRRELATVHFDIPGIALAVCQGRQKERIEVDVGRVRGIPDDVAFVVDANDAIEGEAGGHVDDQTREIEPRSRLRYEIAPCQRQGRRRPDS